MCDFQATSLKVKRVKAASPSPSVWCGVLSTYRLIKMPSQKVAHSGAISVGLGWTTGWGEVYSTNKHLHMAKTVKPQIPFPWISRKHLFCQLCFCQTLPHLWQKNLWSKSLEKSRPWIWWMPPLSPPALPVQCWLKKKSYPTIILSIHNFSRTWI